MITYPRQILYLKSVINLLKSDSKYHNNKLINYLNKTFNKKFKVKNMLPISQGRFGIFLSCREAIKNKKKEILMSPFTIFDLVNMVLCANGKPIFCDIAKNSNHLTLKNIRSKVNRNTAALILTHYETINPEMDKIYSFCKKKKIILINDLAISIDSKYKKKNLSKFSDFSIFSFGFYKFSSSILGGGLYVKNQQIYRKLHKELLRYKTYKFSDFINGTIKFMIYQLMLSKLFFNFFTFFIFKFSFLNNIKTLLKLTKNDPNPFLRKNIPSNFLRILNFNQIQNIQKSFRFLENNRKLRKRNYLLYRSYLSKYKIVLNYSDKLQANSSFINFPILVNNKKELSKFLMINGFDISQYFYRDCSSINIFKKYNRSIYNTKNHVKKLIILPTHHQLTKNYIIKLCNTIEKYYEKK